MKTQILKLEPHDDVVSVKDKLGWKQAGRILLVWPERGHILDRRLDLLLLKRHSYAMGSQLALVTNDPLVRFHAQSLDIPCFDNPYQAQHARWRDRIKNRRRTEMTHLSEERQSLSLSDLYKLQQNIHPIAPPWLIHPLTRLSIFIIGVLAVLALAAFLIPAAQIYLDPQTQTQSLTLDVWASPDTQTINLAGGLPAKTVNVLVEGRDSIATSGSIELPATPASGYAVFTNLTDQVIEIPAGTIITTLDSPPVRFSTIQKSRVSAGVGQTTQVPIQALLPGLEGNLPANSLIALESPLGLNLSVSNPEPTQGGSNQVVASPTRADRERLYARLVTSLQQSALAEVKTSLEPGSLLLTPTPKLNRVVKEKYIPQEGAPAETLELTLGLEFQAIVVSIEDITTFTQIILDANLPDGYKPLTISEDVSKSESITINHLTVPVWDADSSTARWKLQVQRPIQATISETQVINLILGVSPEEAAELLTINLPIERPPRVTIIPAWWPRLPFFPLRISVVQG